MAVSDKTVKAAADAALSAQAVPSRPAPLKPKPAAIVVHILSMGAALCDEFSRIRTYPFKEGHDYTGFENYKAGQAVPNGGAKDFVLCTECKDRADQYLGKK